MPGWAHEIRHVEEALSAAQWLRFVAVHGSGIGHERAVPASHLVSPLFGMKRCRGWLPSGGNIPEEILDLITQVPDGGLDRLGRGEHNLR